jgi:transcriptional regulator with XRE-family HTH domain
MPQNFGNNIKNLLREKNLSARAFAKKINKPQKTVQEWIHDDNNRIPRDPNDLKKIANYFGCSIYFLLFGEEDPNNSLKEILDKMGSKENCLSIDKVYLKDYLENLSVIHMGKSSMPLFNDIPTLITSAIKDSRHAPNIKLDNALLYLEVPNSTEFQKIIEFCVEAEDLLQCPFNYAVANSNSNEARLCFITKTN